MMMLGDARRLPLRDESAQCVVTSPPFWRQRNYRHPRQVGLERTIGDYVKTMVVVFREVRRVLRPDGTLWLNMGDGFAGAGRGHRDPRRWPKQACGEHFPPGKRKGQGLKFKDLCGAPWRIALALQTDGWWLRSCIVCVRPNPMPQAVKDRPQSSYDHVFLLAKSPTYFCDFEAMPRPFRQDVWVIPSDRSDHPHFAISPRRLVEVCVMAGSRRGDVVLDPFAGCGTTVEVCERFGRRGIGLELNRDYIDIARRRTTGTRTLRMRYIRCSFNTSQSAMAAARLTNLGEGRPKKTRSGDLVDVSQDQAAELLNVSTPSVKRAKIVIECGTPELIAAVETGRIAVSAAAKLTKLPPDTQRAIVKLRNEPARIRVKPTSIRLEGEGR
jgi:site-specific DNA-methyltransferase (cytosine-N4-specific)